MSNIAIKAENISKQYRLGEVGTGTLSHDLTRLWAKFRGKKDPFLKIGEENNRTEKGESDYVWSLKDINFEIQKGDAVGIIGRNGAGKSTLLKLLSKITKPTTGNIYLDGRVASLLEVGTGFQPMMTGRENIYLNGAILGMSRKEIARKFDEIVHFSGVERYIDTPVKRYSSGMYVRLAFAVAAHLESEILIIDEVLAVGDADFQKKCLGKMGDISHNDGRTVLFVSHNMAAVQSLCNKGILLDNGKITHAGDIKVSVSNYIQKSKNNNEKIKILNIGTENVMLDRIEIASDHSSSDFLFDSESIELKTHITINSNNPERYHFTYHIFNELMEPLFSFTHIKNLSLNKGSNEISCTFPKYFFQSGNFTLDIYIVEDRQRVVSIKKDVFSFSIEVGNRDIGGWMGREPGYIRPKFEWKLIEKT